MPRTMLWRFGSLLMAAQFVVAVGLGVYAYATVRDFNYAQRERDARRVSALVAEACAGADPDHPLGAMVERMSRETGVVIAVFDRDGVEAAFATPDATGSSASWSPLGPWSDGGARRVTRQGEPFIAHATPVTIDGETLLVQTALPLAGVDRELGRILRLITLAGAASILLTFAVTYLISRRLAGQVMGMARSAARFARGQLEHRIPHPPTLEMNALASSLNEMAVQLGARMEELRDRQAEQQAILSSMSNGVIALDLDHHIMNMNRAAGQLLGADAKAARGKLLQQVARQPELIRFVEGAMVDDSTAAAELRLTGPVPMTVQAAGERLRAPDGEVKGLLLIFNDVTRLRRLESLRSDFAANVSHELRTPITNIKGYVETLLEIGWSDHEQASRFLEIIRTNASRLAAIVEDVMAITKLEQPAASDALERERAPMTRVVNAVLSQFRPTAEDKGITLAPEVEPGLVGFVHAPLIEQAIGNLVANAIAYSPPQTAITVTARTEGDAVVISVADQGPGIAEEHLPRLFERFYRVDKARSRREGGTGLGLAIVKHIALLHGGRAEASSKLGEGSVFRITLPGAAAAREDSTATSS